MVETIPFISSVAPVFLHLSNTSMQSERLHLEENESLQSAIHRQILLNRKSSASQQSVDYQPEFESSIRSIKLDSKIYPSKSTGNTRNETGRKTKCN